jgi:hypothetical protein
MRAVPFALVAAGAALFGAMLATAQTSAAGDAGSPSPDDGGVPLAASAPQAGPSPGGFAPDPPALVTKQQWIVDLSYDQGQIALRSARRLSLERPTPTPRMMGRFALELYVGRQLLDRVRFDFPMLGAGEYEDKPRWDSPPGFERRATSSAAVMVPHSERATRLVLLDRASGRTWPLPWPPPPNGEDRPRDAGAR